jgi:beta-lactamase superfamily II metal-dependent hydrolase
MPFVRLLLVLLALLATFPAQAAAPRLASSPKGLTVHFFDVGQGDAALIRSPTGKTVLIDGGPPEAGKALAARLRELVSEPLDLVILTHPHLDHLGGLDEAMRAVGARRYMDPGFDHPSEAYRNLLEFVGHEVEGQVMTPTPNPSAPHTLLSIGLGEGVTLTILWPRHPGEPFLTDTRSDANSNSIVAKLTYGKTAVLFMGDAEPDTEKLLLGKPLDFSATILKVAHHGGRLSSTPKFLDAVKPQAAVISCATGNEYGHPAPEVLQRLERVGSHVFRTDLHGEVVAVSNGTTFTLTTAQGRSAPTAVVGKVRPGPVALGVLPASGVVEAEPRREARTAALDVRFVSLKGSKVFHREDCSVLKRAKTKERTVYANRTAAERDRRPAEDCHP